MPRSIFINFSISKCRVLISVFLIQGNVETHRCRIGFFSGCQCMGLVSGCQCLRQKIRHRSNGGGAAHVFVHHEVEAFFQHLGGVGLKGDGLQCVGGRHEEIWQQLHTHALQQALLDEQKIVAFQGGFIIPDQLPCPASLVGRGGNQQKTPLLTGMFIHVLGQRVKALQVFRGFTDTERRHVWPMTRDEVSYPIGIGLAVIP